MSESPNGVAPGDRVNGIEATGLAREFKGGVRAVDGIDIEVRPGEIYGFLGPNGAGKSTTVHMLTTLLPPTAGSAKVAGFDVLTQGARVRDAIGAALQEAALDPQLSAREHMRLQGALHGLSKAERSKRGDELIERVGLTDAADRKVGGYSGGMKRRLDLALALLHGPSVLFLDEPTTGLDIQSRTALWDEVASLSRDQGMTVFLTTQYLEEADQLAERVGIIDHGRIVAEGTPAALKAEVGRPTVEAVPADLAQRERAAQVLDRFGELVPASPNGAAVRLDDGPETLAAIVRAFDDEGLVIANIDLHAPSLNDVFLAKTGRSLEGAAAEEEATRRGRVRAARDRGGRGLTAATVGLRAAPSPLAPAAAAPDRRAGAALDRAHPAPAGGDRPRDAVPADPARDQRRRARLGDRPAGLPHRLLHHLRAGLRLPAGGRVRSHRRRPEPRRGPRERLLQPPAAHPDPPLGPARGAARGHARARACCRP